MPHTTIVTSQREMREEEEKGEEEENVEKGEQRGKGHLAPTERAVAVLATDWTGPGGRVNAGTRHTIAVEKTLLTPERECVCGEA